LKLHQLFKSETAPIEQLFKNKANHVLNSELSHHTGKNFTSTTLK